MPVTSYTRPPQGAPVSIQGHSFNVTASCTTDPTTSAEIDRRGYPFGSVYVPTGSTITTITWYGCYQQGVTARAALDQDHVAITQTVAADQICELPAGLAGMGVIVPVTNAAGTLYFHFER